MWEVSVRRSVRPLIDALEGKRTGYGRVYTQLQRDPCLVHPSGRPFAYRISGPLGNKVCGIHLDNKYRLAFTMRPSPDDQHEGVIEILYAGKREPRLRSQDVWTIVHDLFDEHNPPEDHSRRPCCEAGLPSMDEDELQQYMTRLRRFLRGR